jgi:tetratricopeptide (TPR) repeat protein
MMARFATVLLAVLACAGCGELRGRKKIQEGTAAFKRGDFVGAVGRFREAVAFVPEMPLLWLNLGYACRELIVPGAPAAENRAPALCALDAFKHLRELAPADPRGDRLYVQTLFDAGEFKTIERTFSLRHEKNPADLDVVLALEQVYVKTGRWRDALTFYRKAAALRPRDPEAAYAVGTFIWQTLAAHGGGPAVDAYDPRPHPKQDAEQPPPRPPSATTSAPSPIGARAPRPPPAAEDIAGDERLALCDEGIHALERALELRPRYPDALTYIGLLYRQKSFALFDDLPAWERAVGQAAAYSARAAEKP